MPIHKWTRYTCNRCNQSQDFLLADDFPEKHGWTAIGGEKGLILCARCFPPFHLFMSGIDPAGYNPFEQPAVSPDSSLSAAPGIPPKLRNRDDVLAFIGDSRAPVATNPPLEPVTESSALAEVRKMVGSDKGAAMSVTVGRGIIPR